MGDTAGSPLSGGIPPAPRAADADVSGAHEANPAHGGGPADRAAAPEATAGVPQRGGPDRAAALAPASEATLGVPQGGGPAGRAAALAPASGATAGVPQRDHEAVRRFIEDFASALAEMGVPRMPARVFVALLTSESGRLAAADLAGQLRASPAAMSGALRYLLQIGLIRREGQPGSRRHYYRVPDDVWDELITLRNRAMSRWTAVLREGVPILGADTPAGARLAESVRYFEFVSAELPLVIARWRERKAAHNGQAASDR